MISALLHQVDEIYREICTGKFINNSLSSGIDGSLVNYIRKYSNYSKSFNAAQVQCIPTFVIDYGLILLI